MTEPEFRKSSFCATSACVEVAFTCVEVGHDAGDVLVRDSKNPGTQPLRFTAEEWRAFLATRGSRWRVRYLTGTRASR
jgi:hypothetical protein